MLDFKETLAHSRTHADDLYVLSLVLATAVKKMLNVKGGIYLSAEPDVLQKPIVEFSRRMRIDGLEKFGDRTVISAVKFYRDEGYMNRDEPVGVVIVYIPVTYIARLLKMLEYPLIDEDDDELVLDACGTIVNLIAGYFIKEISGLGYVHLQMSHFESYINSALNGIAFAVSEEVKYEINFEINSQKRIVVEFSLGNVPHV
jgi:hypothetical protein